MFYVLKWGYREHMQSVAVLMAVSEQSREGFHSWAWWILALAYPSLDQRGKSGVKISKTGLFHMVNILCWALALLIHVCLIFFTEDYQGNRWNSEQISTPVVLKQTSQAGVGIQMPPLNLCVGFCFKFPNTWGEGMKILVGRKCRLESVLVCLLLLGREGPGYRQSISLTSQVGAPPSHKANKHWKGKTNPTVSSSPCLQQQPSEKLIWKYGGCLYIKHCFPFQTADCQVTRWKKR